MKVHVKNGSGISKVEAGQVFFWNQSYWLKTTGGAAANFRVNCVNLETGDLSFCACGQSILPVEAEVSVK